MMCELSRGISPACRSCTPPRRRSRDRVGMKPDLCCVLKLRPQRKEEYNSIPGTVGSLSAHYWATLAQRRTRGLATGKHPRSVAVESFFGPCIIRRYPECDRHFKFYEYSAIIKNNRRRNCKYHIKLEWADGHVPIGAHGVPIAPF